MTRAVADAVAAARTAAATDGTHVDVHEYQASALAPGELAEMLSPSLFGGWRIAVVRDGQDAKKDLAAAILAYAARPGPDATLVVTHAGGAKGKALADGLRDAGATVVPAAKLTSIATGWSSSATRCAGSAAVRRGRGRGAARGGRQRPA